MADGYYRTGDEARRDDDGYIHFVGRGDDVFKSSDYRISPFELESVLVEHELVAEAAVVPSPDRVRLAVPKAFVVLTPGTAPSRGDGARDLRVLHASGWRRTSACAGSSSPTLPKTISGKIRRVELRKREAPRRREARRRTSSGSTTRSGWRA